jgi:hypothetical protein
VQIVRTIVWVVLTAFVVMFVLTNFGEPQRVKIWPSENPIGFDWPVGIIALVFWLLGAIPAWLYHRGVKWSLDRRIRSLETSIKSNALARRHEPAGGGDKPVDKSADKPVQNPAKTVDSLAPDQDGTSA